MKESKRIKLAGVATLGIKGQVVIPAEVREQMGVTPGDKLIVLSLEDKGAVGFVSESRMQSIIDHMGSQVEEMKSVLNNT